MKTRLGLQERTNLEQSPFRTENGDVPIVTTTTTSRHLAACSARGPAGLHDLEGLPVLADCKVISLCLLLSFTATEATAPLCRAHSVATYPSSKWSQMQIEWHIDRVMAPWLL